jgi:chemosensory pili system protein ChpA (sensor histidine kinase/response regulator)
VAQHRSSIVLVVEDDPQIREIYRLALTAAGYAVAGVPDGVDALRVMELNRPAAVVLDLGLPRLKGADVAAEMAAQPSLKDVPIIVVTGQSSDTDPKQFACVLHKPVDSSQLIEAVANCLARARTMM